MVGKARFVVVRVYVRDAVRVRDRVDVTAVEDVSEVDVGVREVLVQELVVLLRLVDVLLSLLVDHVSVIDVDDVSVVELSVSLEEDVILGVRDVGLPVTIRDALRVVVPGPGSLVVEEGARVVVTGAVVPGLVLVTPFVVFSAEKDDFLVEPTEIPWVVGDVVRVRLLVVRVVVPRAVVERRVDVPTAFGIKSRKSTPQPVAWADSGSRSRGGGANRAGGAPSKPRRPGGRGTTGEATIGPR